MGKLGTTVTPDNEMIPHRPASAGPLRSASGAFSHSAPERPRWTQRRGVAGVLASLSVVGFAVAVIAPTGLALAETPSAVATTSLYSLAADEVKDISVTVSGVDAAPVQRHSFEVYVTPTPTPEPVVAAAPNDSEGSEGGEGGGGGGPVYYSGGGAPAEWMAAAGIASGDWGYVDYVVSRESGWNPNATNSSSGACGLVQALPCSKVPGNGYDPVDNLRWANGYATARYGSWAGAYDFWVNNSWW